MSSSPSTAAPRASEIGAPWSRRWRRRKSSFGGDYLHPTVWDMAAAYAFHIAQNQPFVDGNKRAALAAALAFLMMNGIDVDDPDEGLHDALIAIAERRLDKAALAQLFRQLATGEDG